MLLPVDVPALRRADLAVERPEGSSASDNFTIALATTVVSAFTGPGDLVLDPFAGWGTTLAACADLGRRSVGIELLPERVGHIRDRVGGATVVVQGDARRLADIDLPAVDLCFTSPPYRTRFDHPQNPLDGYRSTGGEYETYLTELADIFGTVGQLLTAEGHLVVNVADLDSGGEPTPLAADLNRALSTRLRFVEQVALRWDVNPDEITADYLLIFRRR